MKRVSIYLSIIIFLVSSIIGINILGKEEPIKKELISYVDNSIVEEAPIVNTTTSTTTTTTTTIATRPTTGATTKKKTTTTTKIINQESPNTLTIDGTDKVFYLKKGNASYDEINFGNKYGVLDNRLTFNDKKMIIYGHSYANGGGLFNYFQNYDENYDFFNNHKNLTIIYNNIKYEYEIFSVYVVGFNKDVKMYEPELEYFFNTTYDYNSWLDALLQYKKNSEYPSGMFMRGTDRILIIQTCSTNKKYTSKYDRANLLIFAKLTRETTIK